MDGVEAAGFFFGEAHGFDGDDLEAGFVDAGKNFALLAAATASGLMIAKVRSIATKKFLQLDCKKRFAGKMRDVTKELGMQLGATKSYFRAAASVEPRSAGVSTV